MSEATEMPSREPENAFSAGDRPSETPDLPRPPKLRRWLGMGTLLVVAVGAAWLAASLTDAARFSLFLDEPRDLGDLAHADLEQGNAYVQGTASFDPNAHRFIRRGGGQFLLAQVASRPRLWVVLKVPKAVDHYVPPRRVSGRLMAVEDTGVKERSVLELLESRDLSAGYLLFEGQSPRSLEWTIWAWILAVLVAGGCGWLAFALSRPVPRQH